MFKRILCGGKSRGRWGWISHSLIIIREVLILPLSIFNHLKVFISWYSLATGLILSILLNDMIYNDHVMQYTPCSVRRNTALGIIFLDTPPRANIRNTSSRGKHKQCSSYDANRLIVDICRQAKYHNNGCAEQLNLVNGLKTWKKWYWLKIDTNRITFKISCVEKRRPLTAVWDDCLRELKSLRSQSCHQSFFGASKSSRNSRKQLEIKNQVSNPF